MLRSKVWLVFSKEIKIMLRDRRLIVSVALISLVVLPFLMGFIGNLDRVTGSGEAPVPTLAQVSDPGVLRLLQEQPYLAVYREAFQVVDLGQPYLMVLQDRDHYGVYGNFADERLRQAGQRLQVRLEAWRSDLVARELAARGIDIGDGAPLQTELIDTSDPRARSGALLGTLVPYLAILLLVANANRAMYVAVGEKEKNTMASLLVSNVPRYAIVVGKTFAIMVFAVGSSLLLVVGMILFANFGFSLERLPEEVSYSLSLGQALGLFLTLVSLALLISALIMLIGTFARSAREANLYTTPLLFLAILLAVFSFSNATFGIWAYFVPILGNALAMKDIFLDALDGTYLLASIVTNVFVFLALVWLCVNLYERESILFRE